MQKYTMYFLSEELAAAQVERVENRFALIFAYFSFKEK
jgi:hypothetical protein